MTLQRHLLARREGKCVSAQRPRRPTDQDLVRRRRLLEASRNVDRVAAHRVVARVRPGAGTADDLAGVDADPDLQLVVELRHGLADAEGGPQGPLGVVVVRLWGAEERHGGIPDVLLHGPAEAQDLGGDGTEVAALHLAHRLGVAHLRPPRESDEVREEHRHQPAFVGERHASIVWAEARPLRPDLAAGYS